MRWVTLFNIENVHLGKDVGMIPCTIGKEYDIDCTITTYDNGNYSYLKNKIWKDRVKLNF